MCRPQLSALKTVIAKAYGINRPAFAAKAGSYMGLKMAYVQRNFLPPQMGKVTLSKRPATMQSVFARPYDPTLVTIGSRLGVDL
jgi:hypothetical protein